MTFCALHLTSLESGVYAEGSWSSNEGESRDAKESGSAGY